MENNTCEKCGAVKCEQFQEQVIGGMTMAIPLGVFECMNPKCPTTVKEGGWEEKFDGDFEKLMRAHHSEKMDVFLDSDGASHYQLFKDGLKSFIAHLLSSHTLQVEARVRKEVGEMCEGMRQPESPLPPWGQPDKPTAILKTGYNQALADLKEKILEPDTK